MGDAGEQLETLQGLHGLLTEVRVAYWVFGGWAVDLHAGRVTREHGDIDIVVRVEDLQRVTALLQCAGWSRAGGSEAEGYLAFGRGEVQLEVAFVAFDKDGAIYTPLPHGRAAWPRDALGSDFGEVDGVRVPVISLGALIEEKITDHGDPVAGAKDRVDVAVLRALG